MATSSQSTPQQSSSLSFLEGLLPDSIDTLPVLSAILSRMQNFSPTLNNTAGSPPAASPSQIASGTSPLVFKDIHTATDDLKHKLQKARLQVKGLPDVERSVVEQEEEIKELEERIATQREVLLGLREIGIAATKDREQEAKNIDKMET
jgi:hypothetical protein